MTTMTVHPAAPAERRRPSVLHAAWIVLSTTAAVVLFGEAEI
ncbi:hypothetical protein LI90_3986 [Carbonactinospora thermoautotrophica]|uniref:Uncharacterized protein n=1 Tax=Carbonactinospora thermoautotrophica TaxID=1469144 RepID=A0A132MYP2_9ACTN|nr:hypothetical protein [Carbonactinospora thermoautotrophica]KWX02937.1 hypothetical protein LI90_3986 [Carbonactinospora thermoautotrophica]